jgi:thiol-disulfide isomerase/thioredoxin
MKKSVVLIEALLGCAFFSCSSPGRKEPEVRVVNLQGLEAALGEHRGEGVLLNFWAIWCEPCVAEFPELLEVADEYRKRGGTVVGVSYDLMVPGVTRDDVLPQVQAFVAERKIKFPILIYDAADYDAINQRYDLPGPIPVTLALGRKGAIVDRQEGQSGKARFVAMMQKALEN